MRPIAIIQARCGSTRFPGKVLKPLAGHNVLYYVIRRCQLAKTLAGVVVATTEDARDDALVEFCAAEGVPVYRGSLADVLHRYVEAAVWCRADPIVRITSDCPLIEPAVIDLSVQQYATDPADYVFIRGFPRGSGDAEVMPLAALRRAMEATRPEETYYREHVMTYLIDHPEQFRLRVLEAPREFQELTYRLCVDEEDDLKVVQAICAHFAPRIDFSLSEIVAFLAGQPEIAAMNRHVQQKAV